MDDFKGTYYLQNDEGQPAALSFLKDKLSIGLRDAYHNPKIVYWYYDKIMKENIWQQGKAIIHYTGYPVQTIETTSREFADRLTAILNRRKTAVSKVFNLNVLVIAKLLAIFLGLIALIYFWLVPFLAVRLAGKVPVSYEENLGNSMYNAMKPGFKIDAPKTAYANQFFNELKIPTAYNIRITVVNENAANAFAMPGGNIVVYDKIIAGMNSYEELAALLSHEFTHVQERHTTKTLFKKIGSSLLLSVIFGDVGAIGAVIINNANELESLSYSRGLEKEADKNGVKMLAERKIDANGFVNLFELLKKQPGAEVSEWVSSHPDLDKRIAYIRNDENFNSKGVEKNETLYTLFLKIKGTAPIDTSGDW